MTTTPDVDLRALVLGRLCELQGAAAMLGLRVEGQPGLAHADVALVYGAAEGCHRLLALCQDALPAEGGDEAAGGEADAT
jgi:hypothetical protein